MPEVVGIKLFFVDELKGEENIAETLKRIAWLNFHFNDCFELI